MSMPSFRSSTRGSGWAAAQRDAGFERAVLARMLAGFGRVSDRQFREYGVDQPRVDGIHAQVEDWRQELQSPDTNGACAAEARASMSAANRTLHGFNCTFQPSTPGDWRAPQGTSNQRPRYRRVIFAPGDHDWLRSLVRVNLLLWEVLSACVWMTLVISQGRKTLRRQPGTWGGCGDRANRGDRRCGSHP